MSSLIGGSLHHSSRQPLHSTCFLPQFKAGHRFPSRAWVLKLTVVVEKGRDELGLCLRVWREGQILSADCLEIPRDLKRTGSIALRSDENNAPLWYDRWLVLCDWNYYKAGTYSHESLKIVKKAMRTT
jgi:hypothetical protein